MIHSRDTLIAFGIKPEKLHETKIPFFAWHSVKQCLVKPGHLDIIEDLDGSSQLTGRYVHMIHIPTWDYLTPELREKINNHPVGVVFMETSWGDGAFSRPRLWIPPIEVPPHFKILNEVQKYN